MVYSRDKEYWLVAQEIDLMSILIEGVLLNLIVDVGGLLQDWNRKFHL